MASPIATELTALDLSDVVPVSMIVVTTVPQNDAGKCPETASRWRALAVVVEGVAHMLMYLMMLRTQYFNAQTMSTAVAINTAGERAMMSPLEAPPMFVAACASVACVAIGFIASLTVGVELVRSFVGRSSVVSQLCRTSTLVAAYSSAAFSLTGVLFMLCPQPPLHIQTGSPLESFNAFHCMIIVWGVVGSYLYMTMHSLLTPSCNYEPCDV